MNDAERLRILELVQEEIKERGYVVVDNPFVADEDFRNIEYSRGCLENRLSFVKENHIVGLQSGVGGNSKKRKLINKVRQIAVKIMNPIVSQQNGINTNSYEIMLQMYAYISELEKRVEELEGKSGK